MLSDAMQYFHGAGAAIFGPVTSTAVTASSITIAGTVMTVTTLTTGQIVVGMTVSGVGVTAGTYITSLGTGIGLGAGTTYNLNVASTVTTIAATFGPPILGDVLTGNAQYSNNEIDFGAPSTGTAFPFISEYPSLTEKGYTYPPEVVGSGGVQFGVHIVIGAPMLTAATTSIAFSVLSASTTAPVIGTAANIIATRTLTAAQLAVNGAHYFIPVEGTAVKEFLQWYAAQAGGVATTGYIYSWWGPKCGGEQ